ncbi:MAG: MurT ligase domain-containing protein [Oscillospiraceae bacterium]
MNVKASVAIIVCKGLRLAARVLHRGGTAMPGRVALKICPGLLGVLSRNVHTVAVTGTNGKTTTARMIEKAFSDAGLNYMANRSGANLISGITTEFAMNSTIFGRCKKDYAVIECDEAAARLTFAQLRPQVVLVTNLFRDQLDRYGEVTHTLANVREGLSKIPDAVVCLNADCSLTASLAGDLPNRVLFYGMDASAGHQGEKPELSDATHCIRCKTEYEYDYLTYGHLGGFRCPACGYARPAADVAVTEIRSLGADCSQITLRVGETEHPVRVNLPAMYNIYNAAGAVAAVTQMGLSVEQALSAVESFHCGFGRMERFDIGEKGARMMLVKNPAGCNQVLEFLSGLSEPFYLVLCLNDRSADGTDVSWIWDVDFERLAGMGDTLTGVTVSGVRAADLWTRLKYAGVPEDKISLERDYEALAENLGGMDKPVFLVPTYTAMLDLRAVLVKRYGGAAFWEG